ncbi:4a-hydroxytetrahydrobiopterin dehydratase [Marinomonas pollencensis]|uniref:Putative pterin-4-alpha-carbinolamine dehydratase n=1 Tax=Marinomonas pollencensis TaxID=491954 RepID=A0A3E0DLM0_9GAMM|nr:4a-hydroxytetrahydrobiopterin dehydratase [Marinomonas pollencensis]REG83674.1 pterin-4-alpha-carbinolamine dehydratase [Marinomonas pollencensis]
MRVEKLSELGISNALKALNNETVSPWTIEDNKLTKLFQFKDFQHAFGFMTMSALYVEKKNHHPEWSNLYNKVKVQLTTHEAGGVSEKDFDLAKRMDRFAG